MKLVVKNLKKNFEKKEVLKDINFEFEKEKYMDYWEETEQVKQHSLIV